MTGEFGEHATMMRRVDEMLRFGEAALGTGDSMRARELITTGLQATFGRPGEEERLAKLRDVMGRIQEFEQSSPPLVIRSPLSELMESCATVCQADCCGPDAYDPLAAKQWIVQNATPRTAEALAQLKALIADMAAREREGNGRVLWSNIFFVAWTPAAWHAYLAKWDAALSTVGHQ